MYGLRPRRTSINYVEAEALGFDAFGKIVEWCDHTGDDWYDRFAIFSNGRLALRTLFITREDYITHLQNIRGRKPNEVGLEDSLIEQIRAAVPPNFWLVEASAPELLTVSRRKFGEVLIPAPDQDPNEIDSSQMLAARLPGIVIVPDRQPFPSNLRWHTPLFTFTNSRRTAEIP